jgi:hypothetical protein
MAEEKFENRTLTGNINVACKFDDGTVRYWTTTKQEVIQHIKDIVEEYQADGYTLTLRQLHYQLVSSNWIVNHTTAYKKLGNILDDCRYGGIIDWDAIEDRGRVPFIPYSVRNVQHSLEDTIEQYRLNRQEGQKNHIELWCLDGNTMVYTDSSVKPIREIKTGDRVFTHKNRFKEVTQLFKSKYKGVAYKISPYYLEPLTSNPQHPFLAVRTEKCYYKQDVLCKRTCYRAGQCNRSFYEKYKKEWIPASMLKKGDFLVVPRNREVINVKDVVLFDGCKIKVDNNLMRIIGYYISEGSVRSDDRSIKFTFHIKEKIQADFIRKYFYSIKKFKNQVGYSENKNVRDVIVYGKNLIKFFSQFGVGAGNKRIPEWCLYLKEELQKGLIDAMLEGDGYRGKMRDGYGTASRELAYQLKFLLDRAGIISSLGVSYTKEQRKDANYDFYSVRVSGLSKGNRFNYGIVEEDYILIPIRKIEKIYYDDYLYNFTVKDDNSYSTGVISHNTEKDALSGILRHTTSEFHVKLVVNKGYTSSSAIYGAYQRALSCIRKDKVFTVLYLGDHDPSGRDMVRDIRKRLRFMLRNGEARDYFYMQKDIDDCLKVVPIGLTMEQIKKYKLPNNPTKLTDSRAKKYIQEFGRICWEVDALKPQVLTEIVKMNIAGRIDIPLFKRMVKKEEGDIKELKGILSGVMKNTKSKKKK